MNKAYAQEFETHEEVGEEAHSEEFEEQTGLDQIISGAVVLFIVLGLVLAWRMFNEFGGKLRAATLLFTLGIIATLFSAFWGSFVAHRIAFMDSSFDTHNFFTALAAVFFILSIKKFTKLIPRQA